MNAQALYVKSGEEFKATGKFFCAKCRMTALSKEAAEACCVCSKCETQKPVAVGKRYCDECLELHHAEMEAADKAKRQALFDAAEEVTEYEFVWWGEACVPDVQDILDDCMYDDLKDLPEFVFAMKPVKFGGFDVHADIYERFNECEMCDDVDIQDRLVGMEEFEAAFDEIHAANKDTTIFWQEDTTRKVRIPVSECLQNDVDNDKPNDSPAPPLRPKGRQGIDKRY